MLETMRNAAKGWLAKLFIGLLVMSFAVWGITDVFRGFAVQDLATVGETKISSEQFRRDLNGELQRLSQQTGSALSLEDARKLGLDQQILDRAINTAVVDAKADSLRLTVSDKAIAEEVAANPAFQNGSGQFDPARLRQLLQSNGMDEAIFMQSQKRDRLRSALTGLAEQGNALPRTLTEALVRYRNETRDARHFSFSVSEADVPAHTPDELKKQYEATPASYTAPEYRSIAILKVEPADVATKLAISEEELAASYDKFKADYFTPEIRTILQLSFPDVAKAQAAKTRIDDGGDILKIAAEIGATESDITFANRKKGDFLDGKIADAAFALAEGAVSGPVEGTLNTALLKAVKVTPEHQQSLDEVRDELTKRVQLEKAHDEIQSIYDAVEDARAGQTRFEDIANKAGLPFALIPAVSAAGKDKADNDVTVIAKGELLKAAFASDVGVENDALTPFDGYVWYEVREVIPSALRPLDEVKDKVGKDYVASKLRSLAAEKAKALIARVGGGISFDTLAQELKATVKPVNGVKRDDVPEGFDGLATLALFATPEKSLTWSLEGDGKSAKVIEVSKVHVPVFSAASAETKAVADAAKAGIGSDMLDMFIKSARASTSVSINEKLWQDIRGNQAQP